MTNFFEKSDLSRNEAENIISDTLKKCDDGELYLENSKSESILLDDNKIKNSSYNSDLGLDLELYQMKLLLIHILMKYLKIHYKNLQRV